MKKCDYQHDPEWGDTDLEDCPTCLREKERTCPLDIYDDTMISFPETKESGFSG